MTLHYIIELKISGGQATHILTKTNNIIQEKKLKEKRPKKKNANSNKGDNSLC
jgi:hypothetical protein